MAGNSPNLGRDLDTQVHETHKSVNDFNPKTSSPRHIIINLSKIKDKEKISKAARRKKKIPHIQWNPPEGCKQICQQKLCRPGEGGVRLPVIWWIRCVRQLWVSIFVRSCFQNELWTKLAGYLDVMHSHNHTIPISRVSLRATSAGGKRLLSQICFRAKEPAPGWQVDYVRTFPSRGHCGSSTQNGHIFWVWIYLPSPPWPVFIR